MASMYAESLRAFLRPIMGFLDDPTVTEVVVNGPAEIWIERSGRIIKTDASFSEEGLLAATRNIAQFVGRTLNEERPRMDARLPDGSRIHVILAPIARKGAILAIRKFMREALTMQRLVELGAITPTLVELLDAAMRLRLNIIVAGGTGSGKTSLLNVLSAYINVEERLVTIEDSAELQMQKTNIISLESRPPDKFGKGEVTLADLLNSALRLRPDRIVVGEVRGGECFSLLQAMNTGHSGSMATTHANTPIDTLRRLETLCLMSGVEIPLVAIRAQVASAVNLVICLDRLADGTRKVTHVAEVLPLDDRGEYRVQDLFVFTATGRDPSTQGVIGYHAPTGIVPTFFQRLRAADIHLPESFFNPATHGLPQPPIFAAGAGDKTVRARPAEGPAASDAGSAAEDWEAAASLVEGDPTPDESVPPPAPFPHKAAATRASPMAVGESVPSPAHSPVKAAATRASLTPMETPPARPAIPLIHPAAPTPIRPVVPLPVAATGVTAESTIQISQDLMNEVEIADTTPIQRPPSERLSASSRVIPSAMKPAPLKAPPARSGAPNTPADAKPPVTARPPARPPMDDTTDPHIRPPPAVK